MEHKRLYGKGLESMKWLPYIDLMSKRPGALKYTTFYQELPDNWQKYLGKQNADSILAAHRTLTSQVQLLQPMQLGCKVLSMPSFAADNAKYDNFLGKEVIPQ